MPLAPVRYAIEIPAAQAKLNGELTLPDGARGVVAFAHGSGSSSLSPRNRYVAEVLQGCAIATLLLDLLTPTEDARYENRFDIALLAERLLDAVHWLQHEPNTRALRLGLFGGSTGAAAALQAAAQLGSTITAVVSRGGRPDLAGGKALRALLCPALLIVGGEDDLVLELNRAALELLTCPREMKVIPGAGHLFEEPGTLEQVAAAAADWFSRYL
jgi:putative phosphoribosyl transferase